MSSLAGWRSPADLLPIGPGSLQVWKLDLQRVDLAERQRLLTSCLECLEPAERQRAESVRRTSAREEYIAGRGLLRRLLGRTLGVQPAEIRIDLGPHGKPRLADSGALPGISADLEFNVAHSGGMILIALSTAGPVGVDVEWMRLDADLLEVARANFHAEEIAKLQQMTDSAEQIRCFYSIWARKEAVLKADGRGLLHGLNFSTLAESSGWAAETVFLAGQTGPDVRYFLHDVEVGAEHIAALATPHETIRSALYNVPLSVMGSQPFREPR